MLKKIWGRAVGLFAFIGLVWAANITNDILVTRDIRAHDNAISQLERAYAACRSTTNVETCLENARARGEAEWSRVVSACQLDPVNGFRRRGTESDVRYQTPLYYDALFWYFASGGCPDVITGKFR